MRPCFQWKFKFCKSSITNTGWNYSSNVSHFIWFGSCKVFYNENKKTVSFFSISFSKFFIWFVFVSSLHSKQCKFNHAFFFWKHFTNIKLGVKIKGLAMFLCTHFFHYPYLIHWNGTYIFLCFRLLFFVSFCGFYFRVSSICCWFWLNTVNVISKIIKWNGKTAHKLKLKLIWTFVYLCSLFNFTFLLQQQCK